MKYKPLPVGIDNFKMLITNGYYFIDKTKLIQELLDKKGLVTLFTRPRRFGKTLNMSMLQYFFEDERNREGVKQDNTHLFDGLEIMQAGKEYSSYMGQYPVINLSLKSAKQPEFKLAYEALCEEIAREYSRHDFICCGNALLSHEKEKYMRILEQSAERGEYNTSLQFLSYCLEKYYKKKVIFLIDEYDVPLENAFVCGFYKEMLDFVRSLFESALKSNNSLEFAVITGCLRLSKESIFTGMNNMEMISVLSKNYDEYFGFTDKEVKQICLDYHLEHKYDLMKSWYNGYVFGKANVYNPWSIVRFIKDLKADEDMLPISYWANTSSNSIVRKMIERANEDTKEEIEDLIVNKTIKKPIHEDITYDEVYKTMDNLWNFMFFTGYFRKVNEWMDEKTKQLYMEIAIPNEEVKYIFRAKILSWFQEKIKEKDLSLLYTSLIHKNVEVFEEELNNLLMETISFNDAYENFYHGFVAGTLSKMEGYIVKSNREGGRGRSDLFIKPVTRRKSAYIIEFKVAKSFDALEHMADVALRQIEERGYETELHDDGYKEIIKYGIAFFGKDCLIKIKE